MPYVSDKQRRYFEGCKHDPAHMKGKCPDEKTLDEFHNAEYHSEREAKKRIIRKGGK